MKNKYIFGGAIIVVFLGVMIYLFTQTNVSYEQNLPRLCNPVKLLKATGSMGEGKNYEIDKVNNVFSFYMKDTEGNQMKVFYHGTIPNNFESSTSVVVTGKYQKGNFHAYRYSH